MFSGSLEKKSNPSLHNPWVQSWSPKFSSKPTSSCSANILAAPCHYRAPAQHSGSTVTQWQGVQRHPDPSSGTHTASYLLLNLLSPGWRVISSVQIQNNGRCTGDRDQGKTRGQHLAHPICRGRGSARARATCSNTSHNHISWIISTLQLQWWREVVRYV